MAPPTTKPRLTSIDPREVALNFAQQALQEHRTATSDWFAPAYSLLPASPSTTDLEQVKKTRLYKTVRRLADYAQGGAELDKPVREYVARILPLIQRQLKFGQKASIPDPELYPEPVDALLARIDTLQDEEPFAVVLRGAHAREQLEVGEEPLTTGQLAILSGMARFTIASLVTNGEIKGKRLRTGPTKAQKRDNPYLIAPTEARRFLTARGVTKPANGTAP